MIQIIAKKLKHRLLATSSFPPSELKHVTATRVLGEERKLGQYKLTDGDKITRFNSFKELQFYSNLVLRNQPRFMEITRSDQSQKTSNGTTSC